MDTKNALPYEESAEIVTGIEGWTCKSCRRYYAKEEHLARYCCARDLPCGTSECKGRMERGYSICDSCRKALKLKLWKALPEVDWDGETPLCMFDDDRYFFSEGDLLDYLEENSLKVEDVKLVICEKRDKPQFDMYDFLQDYLAEGMEHEAMWDSINKRVNAWISMHVPTVWEPSKVRPTLDSLAEVEKD